MVRVLFFARAAEITGERELQWPLTDTGASVEDFWEWLGTRASGAAELRTVCRLARNHAYMGADERILPGDELAVIPPVSGG